MFEDSRGLPSINPQHYTPVDYCRVLCHSDAYQQGYDPTRRRFGDVAAKLEAIHPGLVRKKWGFSNPTTLPDSPPKPCRDTAASGIESDLVVANASLQPVKVTSGKDVPVTIAPNSWYALSAHSGAFLQIDTGACFVFGDEPSVARIPAKRTNCRLPLGSDPWSSGCIVGKSEMFHFAGHGRNIPFCGGFR